MAQHAARQPSGGSTCDGYQMKLPLTNHICSWLSLDLPIFYAAWTSTRGTKSLASTKQGPQTGKAPMLHELGILWDALPTLVHRDRQPNPDLDTREMRISEMASCWTGYSGDISYPLSGTVLCTHLDILISFNPGTLRYIASWWLALEDHQGKG